MEKEELKEYEHEKKEQERRFKVLKVEDYEKQLKSYKRTSISCFVSTFIVTGITIFHFLHDSKEGLEILYYLVGTLDLGILLFEGKCMLETIIRKIDVERKLNDIELELEIDEKIEEENNKQKVLKRD